MASESLHIMSKYFTALPLVTLHLSCAVYQQFVVFYYTYSIYSILIILHNSATFYLLLKQQSHLSDGPWWFFSIGLWPALANHSLSCQRIVNGICCSTAEQQNIGTALGEMYVPISSTFPIGVQVKLIGNSKQSYLHDIIDSFSQNWSNIIFTTEHAGARAYYSPDPMLLSNVAFWK